MWATWLQKYLKRVYEESDKIENYNKDEIVEMFDLPNGYNKNIVEMKELRLRENILSLNELKKFEAS